jgi:hypothetical protein
MPLPLDRALEMLTRVAFRTRHTIREQQIGRRVVDEKDRKHSPGLRDF